MDEPQTRQDGMDDARRDEQSHVQPLSLSEEQQTTQQGDALQLTVDAAEDLVERAVPQSAVEELSEVTSELESIESEPAQQPAPTVIDVTDASVSSEPAEEAATSGSDTEQPPDFASGDHRAPTPPTSFSPSDAGLGSDPMDQVRKNEETPPVFHAPVSEHVVEAPEASADDSPLAPNDGVDEGVPSAPVINDVVAPTALAVAEAESTAGENAITGTPEAAETGAEQAMHTQPHRRSKKPFVIFVVLLVTLLLAGAAVAAFLMQKDDKKVNSEAVSPTQIQPTAQPGEVTDAKALDDYKVVCGDGKVTNARAYKGSGPHKLVVFELGGDEKYALNLLSFSDKSWQADAADPSSAALVVCSSRKVASETKLKVCPVTDAATKVTSNIDYYSSKYTFDVYSALDGKKVGSFESASTATECPTAAIVDKADPKIYARYELASVETSLKSYVTSAIQ